MSRSTNKNSPGSTLLDDLSGLKLPWIKNQDQLNMAEAENITEARRKHLKKRKDFFANCISAHYFKKLHFDMFSAVWGWAGKWRTTSTNIGVSPHQISLQIHELCEDVRYWLSSSSPLPIWEQAVFFHHRLVQIHPFPNGNGRHARLMMDLYLYNQGIALPKWPKDLHRVKTEYRIKYLKALQLADTGDYKALLHFMKQF